MLTISICDVTVTEDRFSRPFAQPVSANNAMTLSSGLW